MAPSAVVAELGEPAGEPKCGVRIGRTSLEARITSVPYGLDKLLQPTTLPPASPVSSPLKAASKQVGGSPRWGYRRAKHSSEETAEEGGGKRGVRGEARSVSLGHGAQHVRPSD